MLFAWKNVKPHICDLLAAVLDEPVFSIIARQGIIRNSFIPRTNILGYSASLLYVVESL